MPFQAFLNRKLIGPVGLYAKDEQFTALTRGVAYNILCQAKKNYFGNKPWSYIKSYIKEIKPNEIK